MAFGGVRHGLPSTRLTITTPLSWLNAEIRPMEPAHGSRGPYSSAHNAQAYGKRVVGGERA
jgi:hypothetical protein